MIAIDTDDSGSLYYDQITQLDGREYVLEFIWSDREDCWLLNITDQGGTQLAMGIKLVQGWPLLRRFKNPALPPGILFVYDVSGANGEIQTPDDLGKRFLLVYIEASDPLIANAQASNCILVFGSPSQSTPAPGQPPVPPSVHVSAPAGSLFAAVRGSDPPILFSNVNDIVVNADGRVSATVVADFQAVDPGFVDCPAHSLSVSIGTHLIALPDGGTVTVPNSPDNVLWGSIDNPKSATLGRGF